MADVSKNQSRGQRKESLNCACGGDIKMHTVYTNRKLRHFAECQSCNKTARKPKDLR